MRNRFVDQWEKEQSGTSPAAPSALPAMPSGAPNRFVQQYQQEITGGASPSLGGTGGFEPQRLRTTAAQCVGADCSDYVQKLHGSLGRKLPRTAILQYQQSERVDLDALQPGDLLFFDNGKRDGYNTNGKGIGGGQYVNHVGTYIGNGRMIHNPGTRGGGKEVDLKEYTKRIRLISGGRPKEVTPVRVRTEEERNRNERDATAQEIARLHQIKAATIQKIRASPVSGASSPRVLAQVVQWRKDLANIDAKLKPLNASLAPARPPVRERRSQDPRDVSSLRAPYPDARGIWQTTPYEIAAPGSHQEMQGRLDEQIASGQQVRLPSEDPSVNTNLRLGVRPPSPGEEIVRQVQAQREMPNQATDYLGQKILGEKPGWFNGQAAEDQSDVVGFFANLIPPVGMANLGLFAAGTAANVAERGPVQAGKDLGEGLRQSVDFTDPNASTTQKAVRAATLGALVLSGAKGVSRGKEFINDAQIKRNVVAQGVDKATAAVILREVKAAVNADAARGNLFSTWRGQQAQKPTLTGQIRTLIAKELQAWRPATRAQLAGAIAKGMTTGGRTKPGGASFVGQGFKRGQEPTTGPNAPTGSTGNHFVDQYIAEGGKVPAAPAGALALERYAGSGTASTSTGPTNPPVVPRTIGRGVMGASPAPVASSPTPATPRVAPGPIVPQRAGSATAAIVAANSSAAKAAPSTRIVSAEGHGFTEMRVDPRQIQVFPGLQYKRAGITDGANAVTDALKGAEKYDQATAGPLTAWRHSDGKLYVMNGHHRRELALRAGEKDVPVRIFEESDGIDFPTARALGALQNLRDGKGTAIDAATVLRDMGADVAKLRTYGLNTRSGVARDAIALLKLDPAALRMVEEGHVPEAAAAGIADAGLPANRQSAAMREAARGGLETRSQGAFLAERARNAPMVDRSDGIGDLFGEIAEEMALAEQSKVADLALRKLATNKRLLAAMTKGRAVGGTVVDAEAQTEAATVQDFARTVMATDPETARTIEREAVAYAKQPTRARLDAAVSAVVSAAEKGAAGRLATLKPAGVGQGAGDRPAGRGIAQEEGRVVPAPASAGTSSGEAKAPAPTAKIADVLTRPQEKLVEEPAADLELSSPEPPKPKPSTGEKPRQDDLSLNERIDGQSGFDAFFTKEGDGRRPGTTPKRAGEALSGTESSKSPATRPDGAQKSSRPGRIEVEPLPGGFDGQISDLVKAIGEIADRRISEGLRKIAGASGVYFPGTTQTSTRRSNDLGVGSHETGHALDDKYNLVGDWARDPEDVSPFDDELEWFWERGGSGGPDKSLPYNRAEGVAEYVRALILNPSETRQRAPKFTKHFNATVPPDVRAKIETVSTAIRRWAGSSALEKQRAAIQTNKPEEALLDKIKAAVKAFEGEDFATSAWDEHFRMLFTDELAPFVTAVREAAKRRGVDLDKLRPSNNPIILARALPYAGKKFDAILRYGMVNAEGETVTPPARYLFRMLDRSSEAAMNRDLVDLESLLVAERTDEKARTMENAAADEIEAFAKAMMARAESRIKSQEELLRRDEAVEVARLKGRVQEEAKHKRLDQGKGKGALERNRVDARVKKWAAKKIAGIEATAEARIMGKLAIYAQRQMAKADAAADRYGQRKALQVARAMSSLTGAGGGLRSATDVARQAIGDLQKEPARYARLSIAAAGYRMWSDSLLRYMVEKGRISPALYKQIRANNQQYAAMNRLMKEDPELAALSKVGMSGAKETIKRFQGSTKTIESPIVNLISATFAMVREADRNEVLAAFAKILKGNRSMYEGQPQALAAIGQEVSEGGVRVFIKGEATRWQFESGIVKAIEGFTKIEMPGPVVRVMAWAPGLLRKGITTFPGFQVRNRIRDTIDTYIKTPHPFGTTDWRPSASGEERRLYDVFGGGIGRGHYLESAKDYYDVRTRMMDEMRLDGKSIILDPARLVGKAFEPYMKALEVNEILPRLASARAAGRTAETKYRSVYDQRLYQFSEARELIDFAQGGTVTKFMSRFVPFLNAQVQGTRSTVNLAAKHPKRLAAKWMLSVLIPTLVMYYWNRNRGDENLEEYRALPAYQRDFFWNIKVGPNLWLRIPKGHAEAIVASGFERAIEAASGVDDAFAGYAGNLFKSFFPDETAVMVGFFKPATEVKANYDFFRDRPIVPAYEDDLALELREGTKNASQLAQFIQGVTGVDSRKADHLTRGFLGEAGTWAQVASDLAFDDEPVPQGRVLNTGVGTFSQSPAGSAPMVRWVLDNARQSGVRANPLGRLLDLHYDAVTEADRDATGRDLRVAAAKLRRDAGIATRGLSDKERLAALEGVLSNSPYKRAKERSAAAVLGLEIDGKKSLGLGLGDAFKPGGRR